MRNMRCALAVAAALALAAAAWAQSNSKEIMALDAAKLVEILQKPDAPLFDKAKACQRLAVVGTKDAVPALVALLPDEKLNLYARFGLEGIPDPAVDEALRAAVGKLQGRPLVGVLGSIGQRKDGRAVELLAGLLTNADKAVASASAGALGRIGTPAAAAVLQDALGKKLAVKNCVGDAGLACAEGLAAVGNKPAAVAMYEAVAKAELPKHHLVGALDGVFRLQQAAAKDRLVALLSGPDEALFKLALGVAREMPGEEVTAALCGEMPKLPPPRQALLLRALGDRKQRMPLATVIAAANSPVAEVRAAAVHVLAAIGDEAATGILLDAALGEGETAQVAREGLKALPGKAADAAIAAKLAVAGAKNRPALFELAGARRVAAATPAIRQALGDADEPTRLAAIAAMGQLVELADLGLLTDRALAAAESADREAARDALRTAVLRMADREAAAARLAACLKTAAAAQHEFLLDLLGQVSGKTALETVVGCAKSGDAALKDLATKVLGDWNNPDAGPALLDIAKNDADSKYRIRALRGYIRIGRQLQLPDDARLAIFHTAMETAARNEEKTLAIDILTRIPSAQTLKLTVAHLDDKALRSAAADAAVKIAAKVLGSAPKDVAAAMQKVVEAGVGGNPGARAKELLDQAQSGAKPAPRRRR